MNEKDSLKELRLQEEFQFLNSEWVESLAKLILNEHTEWVNKNIFSPSGGKLTYLITHGAPNAGIAQGAVDPYSPRMEIRLKLIEEIYQDAFTFIVFSNQLVTETDTLQDLHANGWFKGAPYVFETALPPVKPEWVAPVLRGSCIAMESAWHNAQNETLDINKLRCRFIMFELMLIWTFYHEIGHVLQQHYVFRAEENNVSNLDDAAMDWDLENGIVVEGDCGEMSTGECVDSKQQREAANLPAQARELMADIEGLGIVLSCLAGSGRLTLETIYLLNCSLSCMFQRFYNEYEDNLMLTPLRHPHPAVRDNIAQEFILKTVIQWLLYLKQEPSAEIAAPPFVYMNIRANVFTGLFRSHRIEKRNNKDTLPSYMKLQSEEHRDEMNAYIKALHPHIQAQIARVMMDGLHLVPERTALTRWEAELQERIDNLG